MKSIGLLICALMLFVVSIGIADDLSNYVLETRGDTLVIKDYFDATNATNTLNNAIALDTASSRPAGRVYMLHAWGYYPLANNPTMPLDRPVTIVGDDATRLVKNSGNMPPVVCGYSGNTGGINWSNTLTIKNIIMMPMTATSSLGWAYLGPTQPNCKVVLENDLFEHTRWVEIQSNDYAGSRIFINDCYFVNLSGQQCRRNGGVYDNVGNNTDTMWVENSTHVMAQGMMYKFRNFAVGKAFFNHNTVINDGGQTIETWGNQSNMSVTNNIFINCNVQPYSPSSMSVPTQDLGELDQDFLPSGIINVDTLPGSMPQLDRKILVQNNLAYWDARVSDMAADANTNHVNNATDWVNQSIVMNSRTQGMFDDNSTWPFLSNAGWITGRVPSFAQPMNLMTGLVDTLKTFCASSVDTTSNAIMPDWRALSSDPISPDWPIPIDLSYPDADLVTGGTDGLPLGDLNWFPTQKATYNSVRSTEIAKIEAALQAGTLVTSVARNAVGQPVDFTLGQNYPNPFNPTTTITFSLHHAANVSLKVFDMLGREVTTLVNGLVQAGPQTVKFDASNLASGVYTYKLTTNNSSEVKKMMLVK